MKQFKKTVQHRIMFTACYNIMVLALLVLGVFRLNSNMNLGVNDFISGFHLGGCVGIQLVMLYYMSKYIAAVLDDQKLETLYIEEHDERTQLIADKTGGTVLSFMLLGLLLATMIAGLVDATIFYTLLGATIFGGAVRIVSVLYYKNKY